MSDLDEGYRDLYVAIFAQAVKDDVAYICKQIKRELRKQEKDEGFIKAFIKKHLLEITKKVRAFVYQEAQEWPNDSKPNKTRQLCEQMIKRSEGKSNIQRRSV